MTLRGVEKLMYELNKDRQLAQRFQADRAEVIRERGRDLDPVEIEWLEEGDVLSLYRHGVHPLLLVAASRVFGLDQAAYRAALKPARGERRS